VSDQAREYLSRVLPWPQGAFVNIHYTFQNEKFDRPGWGGRACRTVDEAVKAVDYALKNVSTRDIYVCLSAQERAEARTAKNGWEYYAPIRSQTNAVALKSFFLDIDCKDEKGYGSPAEAVTALAKFVEDSGMPRPTVVVMSGGGLHVYWTLTSALTPHEWKPRARALAEATKALGLKCDTAVTVDAARILRVPGTFNLKTGAKRPVRIVGRASEEDCTLEQIDEALEKYLEPPSPVLGPLPEGVTVEVDGELSAGVEQHKAPPAKLDELAKVCPFVKTAVDTGGAELPNPLWNLTTLIATFCEDDRASAHRMADQHPGYTPESTDALFDRKVREKAEKGLGWPSCKTISASGCEQCSSCSNFIGGRTPFHFLAPPPPPSGTPLPKDWDLPKGYIRDVSKVINKVAMNIDGSSQLVPIINYPMYEPWLTTNPWTINFTSIPSKGRERQVAVKFSDVFTQGGLRGVLGEQGLALRGGQPAKDFEAFMTSWIEKLQTIKEKLVCTADFGWAQDPVTKKIDGFVYQSLWTPTDPLPATITDPEVSVAYTPAGTAEPWFEAMKLVTSQGKPELNAILASSFGAPLVKFAGQDGVMFSVWSSASGIGKTTALKTAAAVWGDPKKSCMGLNDTANSVTRRIGQLRSLPMYWDELKTEEDTKKFINLVFELSRGREKSRLNSNVQTREIGSWQTMLVSASNESIVDHVVNRTKQSLAGIMRVFEYEITGGIQASEYTTADGDRIMHDLADSYGHAGLGYAKFLGANFEQIKLEVQECRKRVDLDLNATHEERYWSTMVTAVLMGARYGIQLGYLDFNEADLKDFLYAKFKGMREYVKGSPNDMTKSDNVEAVLSQYLNAMRARHMLVTNRIHVGPGKPLGIKVVSDTNRLEAVYVHMGKENRILRIASTNFSDWLKERGYTRQVFMRSLERDIGCRNIKGRMGAGTQYATGTEYVIEIDLIGNLKIFLEQIDV
jgi:hypothetical protein